MPYIMVPGGAEYQGRLPRITHFRAPGAWLPIVPPRVLAQFTANADLAATAAVGTSAPFVGTGTLKAVAAPVPTALFGTIGRFAADSYDSDAFLTATATFAAPAYPSLTATQASEGIVQFLARPQGDISMTGLGTLTATASLATNASPSGLGTLAATASTTQVWDNFDRADGAIGSNWTQVSTLGRPVISGNLATGGFVGGSIEQDVGYYGRYTTARATDNHEVSATVQAASPDMSTTKDSGLFLRAHASEVRFVGASFTRQGVTIATWTPSAPGSGKQSEPWTIAPGDRIRFKATGSTYRAYVNDTLVVEWTDSGNVITPGPTQRYTGMWMITREAFTNPTGRSFGLDDWVTQDV